MSALTNSFWAGLFYLLAGTFALIRHFLLEPAMAQYPKAPRWLLHVFFGFAVVLIYAGLRFLTVWWTGEGATIPPGATNMGVLLAFALLVYKAALMANVMHQRLPAHVWQRLDRIAARAHCPRP